MPQKELLQQLIRAGTSLIEAVHDESAVHERVVETIAGFGFDRVRLFLRSENGDYVAVSTSEDGRQPVGAEMLSGESDVPLRDLWTGSLPRVSRFVVSNVEGTPNKTEEILYVPLVHERDNIGYLSAESAARTTIFTEQELPLLIPFAEQAAAAIVKSHLISGKERQAKALAGVLEVSAKISSSLDLDSTLRAACQAAVELIGVSHSGLALFDETLDQGFVRAEFPQSPAMGVAIQLKGVSLEEQLIRTQEPIVIQDVANEPALGTVRETLVKLGIQSILIVPVVSKNRILGSFSLDEIGKQRVFTAEEIELCKILAAQLAIAIDNAQLYEKSRERAAELEALQQITMSINDQLEFVQLPLSIINHAVELLKCKSGGIYDYDSERELLTVIADFNRQAYLGKTLNPGEGMCGRLLLSGQPFMIIDDYNNWDGRAPIYSSERGFGAVLAVPLTGRERVIGILYVDDLVGRKFSADDVRLLRLFASTASIALDNAKLLRETQAAREAFQSFYKASNILISSQEPKQVLNDIVRQLIRAAGASGGCLILIDESEQVRHVIKESSGPDHPTLTDVIRPEGLSIRVMRSGEPEIIKDLSECPDLVNPIMLSEGVRAAVCLPLVWKGQRIGVMWLHYDEPRMLPAFELEALQLYLNQAAIAYDGSRRMDELERMRQAAESLTATTDVGGTLDQVSRSGINLFDADSVAICSYDSEHHRFIAEDSKAQGIPSEEWEEFLKVGLREKGTVYTVLGREWVGVDDIQDEKKAYFLGQSTRSLLSTKASNTSRIANPRLNW